MGGGMKMLAALVLVAVATTPGIAIGGPAARKVVRTAPVKADWTKRVIVTAAGGFLVGNPAARAKLVEYGSLSCPYCQQFHREAIAGLRARIATGDMSFEFRPFAVHSADPILHALLRCAGPTRYSTFSDDFYDGQVTIAAAYEKWVTGQSDDRPQRLRSRPHKICRSMGLYGLRDDPWADPRPGDGLRLERQRDPCPTSTRGRGEQESRCGGHTDLSAQWDEAGNLYLAGNRPGDRRLARTTALSPLLRAQGSNDGYVGMSLTRRAR